MLAQMKEELIMNPHIVYICNKCGAEKGSLIPDEYDTWHFNSCDICDEFVAVTNKRNFGVKEE